MEGMNLLDLTIKYFNVIVFVLCVLFGMTSFLASLVAWREIKKKNNILRSVVAAYNIVEDTMEKGRTAEGDVRLDPNVVETVFNSVQEILNVVYGEMTGKPMPPLEDRLHGAARISGTKKRHSLWRKTDRDSSGDIQTGPVEYVEEERPQDSRHAYHP
ncbi:MAG: hypothetical protein QG577_1269 [Thermodesulfobacteriota bacterium]|nr:hypothetical protein [Thermodesulfobacteriota bacterium]